MSVVLYRLAGIGLACALVAPASAQLLARKDLSAATALTIAQTAIATCTANGYRVSATIVGRNGEVSCRCAATGPGRTPWRTASRRPSRRAPSAFRRARWKIG